MWEEKKKVVKNRWLGKLRKQIILCTGKWSDLKFIYEHVFNRGDPNFPSIQRLLMTDEARNSSRVMPTGQLAGNRIFEMLKVKEREREST